MAVDQSIEDYFQVFVDKIHMGFHQNVKCILPCHGGIYLDNLTLCTNTSLYEMALQLLPRLENDNTTLRLVLKVLDDTKKMHLKSLQDCGLLFWAHPRNWRP